MFFVSTLFAQVNIVASTEDLANIAELIGGERVQVSSIAKGNQNPHYIEVLPSYMLKVKRADIYLKVGLELDLWANQIIDGSRNRKLKIVDCSKNIVPLEIPTTKVDASMGDIHRFGNPHYWLDPENGKRIAESITDALVKVDPEGRSQYEANLLTFQQTVDNVLNQWLDEYADLDGKELIFYHNSWPYFIRRFGLRAIQFVEPKPGIVPTPMHLEELINVIQASAIRIIAMEPYFSDRAPKFLARKTGVGIVKIAPSVNALPGTETYLDMIEYNLRILKQHLGENHD